jgi:hypothetical protein
VVKCLYGAITQWQCHYMCCKLKAAEAGSLNQPSDPDVTLSDILAERPAAQQAAEGCGVVYLL